MSSGFKIVNTHNDSVRIEFKTHPFRESHEVVLVNTQVHGGLKNYQWMNVPSVWKSGKRFDLDSRIVEAGPARNRGQMIGNQGGAYGAV